MNLHDFLSMGGYGAYVWSCYGLTVAVLVWIGWSSRRGLEEELLHAKRRVQVATEQAAADQVAAGEAT